MIVHVFCYKTRHRCAASLPVYVQKKKNNRKTKKTLLSRYTEKSIGFPYTSTTKRVLLLRRHVRFSIRFGGPDRGAATTTIYYPPGQKQRWPANERSENAVVLFFHAKFMKIVYRTGSIATFSAGRKLALFSKSQKNNNRVFNGREITRSVEYNYPNKLHSRLFWWHRIRIL